MGILYKHPDGHKLAYDPETMLISISDDGLNKVSIPVGIDGLLKLGKAFIKAYSKARIKAKMEARANKVTE